MGGGGRVKRAEGMWRARRGGDKALPSFSAGGMEFWFIGSSFGLRTGLRGLLYAGVPATAHCGRELQELARHGQELERTAGGGWVGGGGGGRVWERPARGGVGGRTARRRG